MPREMLRDERRTRRLGAAAVAALGRRGAAAADAARAGRAVGRLVELIADPRFVEILANQHHSDHCSGILLLAAAGLADIRCGPHGCLITARLASSAEPLAWRFGYWELFAHCECLWRTVEWVESVAAARFKLGVMVATRARALPVYGHREDINCTIAALRRETGPLLGARIVAIARLLSALRLAVRTWWGPARRARDWARTAAAFRVLRPRFDALAGADYPGALDWLAARLPALVRRGEAGERPYF